MIAMCFFILITATLSGDKNEKDIPTTQCEKVEDPWLSVTHGDQDRQGRLKQKEGEGQTEADRGHRRQAILKRYGLSREEKIVSSKDYQTLKRHGSKAETPHCIVLMHTNRLNIPRLGIIVSKKVGNAVKRNRVKRLVRAFFRLNKAIMQELDYIFIAKSNIDDISYKQLRDELLRATKN